METFWQLVKIRLLLPLMDRISIMKAERESDELKRFEAQLFLKSGLRARKQRRENRISQSEKISNFQFKGNIRHQKLSEKHCCTTCCKTQDNDKKKIENAYHLKPKALFDDTVSQVTSNCKTNFGDVPNSAVQKIIQFKKKTIYSHLSCKPRPKRLCKQT